MTGRVVLVALLVLVALTWMLVDAPDQPARPLPPQSENQPTENPLAEKTPELRPTPMPMEVVDLPPPPAPEPAKSEAARKPITVTPLAVSTAPAEKPLTVTPLAAEKPQVETPPARAVEPLKPMEPTKPTEAVEIAEETTPKKIAPLKPEPKPIQKAEPKPEPRPALTPEPKPAEKAVAKTESAPAAPDPKHAAAEGRPLLRLMEHGEGPSVEIAWPATATERRHLYQVFRRCYGMEIAVMDAGGRLFGEDGPAGAAWNINMDRFSGFVRQSSGGAARDEYETARRISERHGIAGSATVRLFPRAADALLLGGLKHLIGERYAGNVRIRAKYEVSGWHVGISGLSVDAKPVAGRVDLSGAASRQCSI